MLVTTPVASASEGVKSTAHQPAEPPISDWLVDTRVTLGLAFGGEELAGQSAGEGITAAIGTSITPFWRAGNGFGFGAELGIKYDSTMTTLGSASLQRFPLAGSVHALLALEKHWYLAVTAGPQWDLAIEYSLGGGSLYRSVAHTLGSGLGLMGEIGALYVVADLGVSAQVRGTWMTYDVRDSREPLEAGRIDASSLGVFFALHYLL